MVQAHIHFSGSVQGVGFRITAQQIANQLQLNGWVKNLSDGRVELIAQGPRPVIEDFISQLNHHFRLTDCQINWQDVYNVIKDFRISY